MSCCHQDGYNMHVTSLKYSKLIFTFMKALFHLEGKFHISPALQCTQIFKCPWKDIPDSKFSILTLVFIFSIRLYDLDNIEK